MDDDICDLPPPQYLGKRRQSTLQEIAAFQEAISFKKDDFVAKANKEISEVREQYP